MEPSATQRDGENIDVAFSYFCRAAHFRSLHFGREARGRNTMGPSRTPRKELRKVTGASCMSAVRITLDPDTFRRGARQNYHGVIPQRRVPEYWMKEHM